MEIVNNEVLMLNVVDIKEDGKNPNRMTVKQKEALKKNLLKFGNLVPIIVNKDNLLADGAQRLSVYQELNIEKIPAIRLDVAEVDRRILRQVLNKLRGEHDSRLDLEEFDAILKGEGMDEFKDLLGEEDKKLEQFLASVEKNGLGDDSLDIEASLEKPKYDVCLGDVWVLGEHRLVCGDCTVSTNIDILLDNAKVDVLFTDPPYGLNIVNRGNVGISSNTGFVETKGLVKAKRYEVMKGDDKPFDPRFLLNLASTVLIFGANNFADKLPISSHWLVWDKKAERGADHNNFSDVELIWTNVDRKSCLIYRYLWSGLLREGNRNTELAKRVHPTQKPVGLLKEILNDYSNLGNIVLDLFCGSGSTLIACEQIGRKCYMMELDEKYCSVIIERWENLTGLKAEKVS